MGTFDQFANQGGAAAWNPEETAEAKRIAEEQLKNADYAGDLPEPLGNAEGTTIEPAPDDHGADELNADAPDAAAEFPSHETGNGQAEPDSAAEFPARGPELS